MTRRAKLKSKDAAALDEFLRGLRSALGRNLLEAKLFGSKAMGKDQPDSDIDVLRTNGEDLKIVDDFPFMLRVSKHSEHFFQQPAMLPGILVKVVIGDRGAALERRCGASRADDRFLTALLNGH